MSIDAENLVRYIGACQSMAGVVLATTLTGFIFLVTRRQPSPSSSADDRPRADVDLMGPFCLLFSFVLGLASFIVFSVMMRIAPDHFCQPTCGPNEFNSWLSPFHLMLMILFLSMTYLAYGTYYVTRDWLWSTGTPAVVTQSQLTILRTVYFFALLGPVLVFYYFVTTVAALWEPFILGPPGVAGVAYAIACSVLLLVFVKGISRAFARLSRDALSLMKTTLLIAFACAGLQLIQNVMLLGGIFIGPLELALVVARTLAVAYAVAAMFHSVREDFRVFRSAVSV